MPDPNELQLELGLDNEKAIAEAQELYDYVEKMTKDFVTMFGEVSTKMESYADGFSRMRAKAESNQERTRKEVGKTNKEVEKQGFEQKKTGKLGEIAGKAMKLAWTDAKAGVVTAVTAVKGLAGLGAIAGGVGAAGGLVALFFGSWLTIDKITVAVNKTLIASEGLRGELTLMSEGMSGKYSKTYKEYELRIHALEKQYKLSTGEASKLVGAYTMVGHAVTDLSKDTVVLAGGFDYLIGQPTGKWLTDRANEAATFGEKMEDAAQAATELYIQFGAFTAQGRKSAITVTDMQASMETASKTMAGWRSDFRSMNEFQEAFIKGSETAGMSSKGAAESFGSFVSEIGNLDMQQLLVLQDTFNAVASPALVKKMKSLGEQWGEGPMGEAFAMKRFMKTSVEKGETGDLSEFIFSMTKSAVEYSKRVGGGDYTSVLALQQVGFSEDNAVKMIQGFDDMERAYTSNQPIANELLAQTKADVVNAQKRAREASMTLASKIQAGISLWWREVAPHLFSTFVNGFGMVVDGLMLVASYLPFGPKGERETAKKRLAERGSRIEEAGEGMKKATAKMLQDTGQMVGKSLADSLKAKPLPEWEYVKKARESELAEEARKAGEAKRTREAGMQGGGGASEIVQAQIAMAVAYGGTPVQAENTAEGIVISIPQPPQKVIITNATFKQGMEEVNNENATTSQESFGR